MTTSLDVFRELLLKVQREYEVLMDSNRRLQQQLSHYSGTVSAPTPGPPTLPLAHDRSSYHLDEPMPIIGAQGQFLGYRNSRLDFDDSDQSSNIDSSEEHSHHSAGPLPDQPLPPPLEGPPIELGVPRNIAGQTGQHESEGQNMKAKISVPDSEVDMQLPALWETDDEGLHQSGDHLPEAKVDTFPPFQRAESKTKTAQEPLSRSRFSSHASAGIRSSLSELGFIRASSVRSNATTGGAVSPRVSTHGKSPRSKPPPEQRNRASVSRASVSSMTIGTVGSAASSSPAAGGGVGGGGLAMTRFGSMNSSITGGRFIINPEQSVFLERWDLVAMCALVFVAVVAPVQVAMLETQFDILFVVSSAVDVVFFIDLVLNFFIMYQRRTDFGYVWEQRPLRIARHYGTTWFPIDFLSILPFDLVSLLSRTDELKKVKAIKIIRLLRLLKLARVLRAARLFHRFEVRTSISYGKLSLGKFFIILFIITHWLACLWALTLVLVEADEGVPRWIDTFAEEEVNIEDKTADTPWKLYIACLYFTSYTITSVGYGDIGPANVLERAASIVMIVVAGISWAVVLGQVCGIVANLDSDEQTFRSNMDELNSMMQDRVLPSDMRQRLRTFFLSNKTAQRRLRHHRLIERMSAGLQGEVVMLINERWISQFSLLKQIKMVAKGGTKNAAPFAAFIVQVALRMESAVHAQQEVFGRPQVLYILNRGLVGRESRVMQTGSVWGTDFVLSNVKLLDASQSYSLTYVELTMLTRTSFMMLADTHGRNCPELQRRVRRYVIWLAFQRAVMVEARRRVRRNRQKAYKRASLGPQGGSNNTAQSAVRRRLASDTSTSSPLSSVTPSYPCLSGFASHSLPNNASNSPHQLLALSTIPLREPSPTSPTANSTGSLFYAEERRIPL